MTKDDLNYAKMKTEQCKNVLVLLFNKQTVNKL
jgi:hypothetical protein